MFTVQRNLKRHRAFKKARRVQRGKALSFLPGFGAKSQAGTAIEKPKYSLSKKMPPHCPAKAIKKKTRHFHVASFSLTTQSDVMRRF
ncbi:hypothetical protein ASE99_09930 [Serratia sp. Leaf51]|nr:hypothetical protein ASE99_09930 [Serratia sp. Leaf51]